MRRDTMSVSKRRAMEFIQDAIYSYAEEEDEDVDISDANDYLTSDTMFILKYGGTKFAVIISDNLRQ